MIQLRPYQQTIITEIRSRFRQGHKRIVMQAPTGSGKTVIFSYMVKQASEKKQRCLILTNRIELLEQAGGCFEQFQIKYENITALTKQIPNCNVIVAMIETIKRRVKSRLDFQMWLKTINLVIIDECHIAAFDPIFPYLLENCYVIGATATPVRVNSKKPLSDNFTSIVEGASIGNLIQQGYLSKPKYYGISMDLSKLHLRNGEFDEKEQEQLFMETKVFSGLKENLQKHTKNSDGSQKKTMIFCPSVASSVQVAHELECLHIDGTMNLSKRERILQIFETDPQAIITNCAITTTGYDCPDIDCIVLYRATTSLPLYLQMIGRGSRVTLSKRNFIILDFGMNIQRFGYWHIDRKWSLEIPKKKSKKKDAFPVKFCPQCGAIVSVNVRTCEYCGYVWEVTEKNRIFAELQELTYAEIQKRMKEADSIEEMERIRIAKGYKVGYLLHKFDKKEQFQEYAKLKGYHPGWVDHQVKIYL